MYVAFEVIKIVGLLPPASLTLGFADVAALGLGAVALAPDIVSAATCKCTDIVGLKVLLFLPEIAV
jgi:hypothetical protein